MLYKPYLIEISASGNRTSSSKHDEFGQIGYIFDVPERFATSHCSHPFTAQSNQQFCVIAAMLKFIAHSKVAL
eukprot:1646963-Pleurochrysis_carterae.AAC.2